ncbi:MAG: D-alanine--D-alanine ligase [bacterium]
MRIKTIGLVLETKEDAINSGASDLKYVYHWREPDEIEAIVDAIRSIGYEVIIIGPPEKFFFEFHAFHNEIDFIMNLSVGFYSRYRLAIGPNLYELCKIPYSGADPYTKMMSQNKHFMKSFWDKMGISTPKWVYIHSREEIENINYPEFPVIVKPAYEGSSIGLQHSSVVSNKKDLHESINIIFETLNMPVIIEHFIEGYEYKVGIIGNEELAFCGIIEDIKSNGQSMGKEFLSFESKSIGKYLKRQCEKNDPKLSNIIRDSLRVYKLFLPVDYGTMDVRVDKYGNHYFLEFNADATLHPQRTLAQCCHLNGLNFNEMIIKILSTSMKRWGIQ